MAVTMLTTAQQHTVDTLVAVRRLERVPVDERRCAAFLEQAETALADLRTAAVRPMRSSGAGWRRGRRPVDEAYVMARQGGMLARVTPAGPGPDPTGRVTGVRYS